VKQSSRTVLKRLREAGFKTVTKSVKPFGVELPLAVAAAWDVRTAQLAFVAEGDGAADAEWEQLLFAVSSIRHQLAGDDPTGFGTPVLFAVVNKETGKRLRLLVERLTANYALFTRVDLNIVRQDAVADAATLDVALASVLPCCRRALKAGATVMRADVESFWSDVRGRIRASADAVDPAYERYREGAAAELARTLVGERQQRSKLATPSPVGTLELRNFRSFEQAKVELGGVTILHGTNGSGKSSILEALELVWAGTSQRRPPDVSAAEYTQHLRRGGETDFELRATGEGMPPSPTTKASELPHAELERAILTQEAGAAIVDRAPAERYARLLQTTGLPVADMVADAHRIAEEARRDVDAALRDAGMSPLGPARDGAAHIRGQLAGGFLSRKPDAGRLIEAESGLASVAEGVYEPNQWDDGGASQALARVDSMLDDIRPTLADDPKLASAIDDALAEVRALIPERQQAAQALRELLDRLGERREPPTAPDSIPPELAVRWLSHAEGLQQSADGFANEVATLTGRWAERLDDYVDLIRIACANAPIDELRKLARDAADQALARPDEELLRAARFSGWPEGPSSIARAAESLAGALQEHADQLATLASELERHPGHQWASHASYVLPLLCRFDLAQRVEQPIADASQEALGTLLQGRMYPVFRELVAAMVRFDWYFEPVQIEDADGKLVLGGLATSSNKLDARLLLNSAERTVVGVAWFLALFLLQPAERRRVLVIDDPLAALDITNRAGFVSTLRAFVRLLQPEQLIVATHDDAAAIVLAEELAPVDGWPAAVSLTRCRRDSTDLSGVNARETTHTGATLDSETRKLGLAETVSRG
jgi:energy-coupling factor transporter ATP-binding protein EcfA2